MIVNNAATVTGNLVENPAKYEELHFNAAATRQKMERKKISCY